METQNPNFRVLHTLTRSSNPEWRGATRRMDGEFIGDAARGLTDPIYYVSGTPSMVVGTLRLLHGLDVAEADIEVEAFRGYQ